MHELRIDIEGGKHAYAPGDTLAGKVSWTANPVPKSAELRLFWYTRGKGTQDVGLINTVIFESPQLNDRREFRLTLPEQPYSCSGKLLSIVWAIELIIEPGTRAAREEFVLGPLGKEVVLGEQIVQ